MRVSGTFSNVFQTKKNRDKMDLIRKTSHNPRRWPPLTLTHILERVGCFRGLQAVTHRIEQVRQTNQRTSRLYSGRFCFTINLQQWSQDVGSETDCFKAWQVLPTGRRWVLARRGDENTSNRQPSLYGRFIFYLVKFI